MENDCHSKTYSVEDLWGFPSTRSNGHPGGPTAPQPHHYSSEPNLSFDDYSGSGRAIKSDSAFPPSIFLIALAGLESAYLLHKGRRRYSPRRVMPFEMTASERNWIQVSVLMGLAGPSPWQTHQESSKRAWDLGPIGNSPSATNVVRSQTKYTSFSACLVDPNTA